MDRPHENDVLSVDEVPIDRLGVRPGRIVVGVDGSSGAYAALSWAAAQARDRGLVLDIVAAWEDTGGDQPGDHKQAARRRVDRALETLARRRLLPKDVVTAPLRGPTGEQLVERAHAAELLVLGTTGISSPEDPHGLGLYCLRHTTTPVVFVPSGPSSHAAASWADESADAGNGGSSLGGLVGNPTRVTRESWTTTPPA